MTSVLFSGFPWSSIILKVNVAEVVVAVDVVVGVVVAVGAGVGVAVGAGAGTTVN